MSQESSDTSPNKDAAPTGPTVAPLPGKDQIVPGAERRVFQRQPLDHAARVLELDEMAKPGEPWECRVLDVSRGGIGLRSRRMIHIGRTLFVIVSLGAGKPRQLLCGTVRQCRYIEGGGGYAIGVKFCDPPRSKWLNAWMIEQGFAPALAAGERPG